MFLNAVPFIDKTAIEIIRSDNFDFDFHKMYHNFHEINKVSSLLYISKDRIEGLELYNENQDIDHCQTNQPYLIPVIGNAKKDFEHSGIIIVLNPENGRIKNQQDARENK